MRFPKTVMVILGVCLAANVSYASTSRDKDTPAAACVALKFYMAKLLRPSGRPAPEWFCDPTETGTTNYHVIALRKPHGTGDEIYSSLVGWFAVSRRNHKVFQWDLETETAVPISPEYGLARPSKK
jgi:hypothetical protein